MLRSAIVKRQFFKFLLSLVRTLVIIKRLFVWLIHTVGRFFVWLCNPIILYCVVPLYQVARRLARRYADLSENPWERRWLVLMSSPTVLLGVGIAIIFLVHGAVAASSQSGVIAGSQSILLTRVFSNETGADWNSDGEGQAFTGSDAADFVPEKLPTLTYRGGAIAYVFPYSGAVGRAPLVEESVLAEDVVPVKVIQPIQKYAVQRGDTLVRLAKKFNLKIETILWANNIAVTAQLHPGDTLIIPAQNGSVYEVKRGGTLKDVGKKFKIDPKLLAQANAISVTAQLSKGQLLLLPGVRPVESSKKETILVKESVGQPKVQQLVSEPPPSSTATAEELAAPQESAPPAEQTNLENGESTPAPVEEVVSPSVTKRPPLQAGEKMGWPTSGHSITQFFSGRHPGLDIDGDYTNPVYAADDGTVIFSGWNNSGYGNMILIDHGNGIQTRYGHNSRVFVHTGQEVHKGDTIGKVGTTGRSTGTHLHFEVMVGGRRVNPFKYVR